MQTNGTENKQAFLKLPRWIKIILVLGLFLLAILMANRDLDREKKYLEDLFLQKGEVLIRSLASATVMGWINLNSMQDLSEFSQVLDSQDVIFIATTDLNGNLLSSSAPLDNLNLEALHKPDPPESFPKPIPHYRVQSASFDQKSIFWVYRPLWFTFGPKPFLPRHKGFSYPKHHPLPSPWLNPLQDMPPPEFLTPARPKIFIPPITNDRKAVMYCWVGFDMEAFEASERAAKTNSILFIGLVTLASVAGIMALFWAHESRLSRKLYQDTNALASEIISRLPVGLLLNDNEGKVTLANQAALKISGLTEKDILGKKLSSLTFGAFPQDEEILGVEVDVNFVGGVSSRLSITGGPVFGFAGTKVGRVILMADLGELGRLKAELAQKEKLATLGSMARGLAHEIRNPLGAIKGLTQHLLYRGTTEQEKEALEVILASVERLAGTITDFLEFARPTEIKTQSLSLGTLLEKIHNLIIFDANCEKVALKLNLPPEPVFAKIDESLLAQAFLNLYLNAIQALRENPPQLPGCLEVSLIRRGQDQAVISFADNGPGFEEEQLARPFVPYFTSKAQGSGLGLAIVKKFIEAHEGQVLLGNQEDRGAIVTVVLPLSAPPKYQIEPIEHFAEA
jgi:two-component system sensor histidine kinase HydH